MKPRAAARWFSWSLVLLLLLAGCGSGGGGGGGGGGTGNDEGNGTPPTEVETTFEVVRTFPAAYSTGVDPGIGVIVFFDDALDPATVSLAATSFDVRQNGALVPGSFSFDSDAGNTVLFFHPTGGFLPETLVEVTLPADGILDDDGHGIASPYVFSFTPGVAATGSASPLQLNFPFSSLPAGVSCAGDCAVLSSFGSAVPLIAPGIYGAYISTGEMRHDSSPGLVSSTPALDDATSILAAHDVAAPGSVTLQFTYNFVSEEIPEFVGSEFDDVFMLVVTGSNGAFAKVVTSVNRVGLAATPGTYPGMPVDSGTDPQQTGNVVFTTGLGGLTSPYTLYFIVSDVGDTIYPTVVMVDEIILSD